MVQLADLVTTGWDFWLARKHFSAGSKLRGVKSSEARAQFSQRQLLGQLPSPNSTFGFTLDLDNLSKAKLDSENGCTRGPL